MMNIMRRGPITSNHEESKQTQNETGQMVPPNMEH